MAFDVNIIYFLLFVLPLVFINSSFELPKIILAEIAIWILLIHFFLKEKNIRLNTNKVFFLLTSLIFALSFFQILIFRNINIWGNVFRLQGVFLIWQLLVFCFFSTQIKLIKIPMILTSISLVLLSLSAILFSNNELGRSIGTLGEPNALAATAVFLWPFLFISNKKSFKFIFPLIALFIIVFSGSRSGLIAYFIQMLFLFLLQKLHMQFKKTFVVSILIVILSLSLPFFEKPGRFESRSQIWITAFNAGLKSPVFGNGFGNVEEAIHETSISLNNTIQYSKVDSSHNIFLDWWVQGGLIGLVLFSGITFFSLFKLIKDSKILEVTLFLGLICVLCFNPASITTLIAFWWLIGQGYRKNN